MSTNFQPTINSTPIDIGIDQQDREQIAQGLSKLLADSYALYVKTHNFHWNVTGPMFQTLHTMFETQYTELAEAIDIIAERIRALGYSAPGSFSEFQRLTSIKDAVGQLSADEMIRQAVEGQETVVRTARAIIPVASEANDEPTADVVTERIQVHEKTAWMMRSLLQQQGQSA